MPCRPHHKAIALLLAALLAVLLPGAPETAFATAQTSSDGTLSLTSDGAAPLLSDGDVAPDATDEADAIAASSGSVLSSSSDGTATASGAAGSSGSPALLADVSAPDAAPSDGTVAPTSPDGHPLGFLPTLSGHRASTVDQSWAPRTLLGLPSKFDLRSSLGSSRVSSVKDQGIYGTCWAFSSLASLESSLLMRGLPAQDLSELQLAYFTYMRDEEVAARGGGTAGDTVYFTPGNIAPPDYSAHYVEHVLNRGGNAEEAAIALANWLGVAHEPSLPYGNARSVIQNGLEARYAYDSNAYHLDGAIRVNGQTDISYVKSLLQTHGAATLEYIHDGLFFFNYDTAAYYAPGTPYYGGGHQVTIVGWDDSFPIKNFGNAALSSPERPPKPGAWICKNSWGRSWGKSGYFYISYYDKTIGDIWFFTGESGADYDYLYQYDGGAFTEILPTGQPQAAEAAVYSAGQNEYICAVGFYANTPNMDVKLSVHTGLGPDEGPGGGTPAQNASITHNLRYEGYYTLPLARPVRVSAGERFGVVAEAACRDEGNSVIFSYDASVRQYGVKSDVTASDGQTFFDVGSGWVDMDSAYDGINLRLKAMSVGAAELDSTGFLAADMNHDGRHTLADAVLLAQACAQAEPPCGVERMRADANADGRADVGDVLFVLRYLVGSGPAPA